MLDIDTWTAELSFVSSSSLTAATCDDVRDIGRTQRSFIRDVFSFLLDALIPLFDIFFTQLHSRHFQHFHVFRLGNFIPKTEFLERYLFFTHFIPCYLKTYGMFIFLTSKIKMTSSISCQNMAGMLTCRMVDLPFKLKLMQVMFRKHIHSEILKIGQG